MSGFPQVAGGYPLGLVGATAATRYVGATASGAPGSGTFAVGDLDVDQSGALWVCTVAGSPGTWVKVGAAAAIGAASANGNNGGDFTMTSASFTDVTNATATIAAAAGDILFVTCKFQWLISSAVQAQFTIITTTGSHTIDYGFITPPANEDQLWTFAGEYTVVSGDISAGNVAVKLRAASNGAATLTVRNSSSAVWRISIINLLH